MFSLALPAAVIGWGVTSLLSLTCRYERNKAMPSPQWYFDRFRLDPDHACLWRDAAALVLPPKLLPCCTTW